jgi:serine-type D-Ala-D-Ala carboxypeptidase (penicillin-binding protein 5/6)
VKNFGLLVALLALLVWPPSAIAQAPFESKAEEAILVDANSGILFYEKNADKLIEPASMSKLMTMILVFEALKKGDVTLDTELPVSEEAWRRGGSPSGGSTMYAELNSRVKVSDLMRGAMIQSANDACIAFAEALAGTEEAFAARMTERGREAGPEGGSLQEFNRTARSRTSHERARPHYSRAVHHSELSRLL